MRKKLHLRWVFILLIHLAAINAQAQSEVSGQVTDASDVTSLPGVNVVVKGTTIGTVTDINGNYRINVPSGNAVLVFSSVGYETEEVPVGTQGVSGVECYFILFGFLAFSRIRLFLDNLCKNLFAIFFA